MKAFQENLQKLEAGDTQVLGVSIDSPFSNYQFAQQNNVTFPLLSDMSAKTIADYGLEKDYDIQGVKMKSARRASFLIDKTGKIVEMSADNEAVDPSKIVAACERHKLAQ